MLRGQRDSLENNVYKNVLGINNGKTKGSLSQQLLEVRLSRQSSEAANIQAASIDIHTTSDDQAHSIPRIHFNQTTNMPSC